MDEHVKSREVVSKERAGPTVFDTLNLVTPLLQVSV